MDPNRSGTGASLVQFQWEDVDETMDYVEQQLTKQETHEMLRDMYHRRYGRGQGEFHWNLEGIKDDDEVTQEELERLRGEMVWLLEEATKEAKAEQRARRLMEANTSDNAAARTREVDDSSETSDEEETIPDRILANLWQEERLVNESRRKRKCCGIVCIVLATLLLGPFVVVSIKVIHPFLTTLHFHPTKCHVINVTHIEEQFSTDCPEVLV